MHRDRLALTLTTFLALSPATLPHRSHAADPTITHLEKARSFAFGGVGFVSAISQSEMDYRAILYRKSAAADFETVFQFGNIQAKCYALTGLGQVNPSRFQSLAATLQSSTSCVPVTRGCQTFNHSMAEVINQIRSGIYSGPMTHDLIPDRGPAKPPPPDQEQTTRRRLLSLISIASSKPDPPPLAVVPPPPPPPRVRDFGFDFTDDQQKEE